MASYSKNDILLVRYPFTDLSGVKVRPAVVVHAPHPSQDSFVVPLTSRLETLQPGEFVLVDWEKRDSMFRALSNVVFTQSIPA